MLTTPAPHHVYGVFGRRMYLHVVSVVGVDVLVVLPVDRPASSIWSCMRGNVQKFVHMLETVSRHGFGSRIVSRGMSEIGCAQGSGGDSSVEEYLRDNRTSTTSGRSMAATGEQEKIRHLLTCPKTPAHPLWNSTSSAQLQPRNNPSPYRLLTHRVVCRLKVNHVPQRDALSRVVVGRGVGRCVPES